jgi:hypothetical protein
MPSFNQPLTGLTPERRRAFLEALRATGSPVAAARAATPKGTGEQAGYSTFNRLRRADPTFAREWEDALADALATIESEIVRRAFDPPRRPVFDGGQVVGWVEDRNSSDRLLLRAAQKLNPDWAERRHITGELAHSHAHDHEHRFTFSLKPEHLGLLDEPDKAELVRILSLIHERLPKETPNGRPELPRQLPAGGEAAQQPASAHGG